MNSKHAKRVEYFWTGFLFLGAGVLLLITLSRNASIANQYSGNMGLLVFIAVIAFFAEYMDSSLGMGYGTILMPVLILLGFSPLQVVPCLLLSEAVSGTLAGVMHHRVGNVNLASGSKSRTAMIILAVCSVFGSIAAVFLALNIPEFYVKLYIGVMISIVGVFLLVGRCILGGYSHGKIVGLGIWAAFNKGISGGGYGPLVTGGQVLLGVSEKKAVGITSLAEGLVCIVSLSLYLIWQDGALYWALALPLMTGALASVPAAAWTVKVLPSGVMRRNMGCVTLYLGGLTLLKLAMTS